MSNRESLLVHKARIIKSEKFTVFIYRWKSKCTCGMSQGLLNLEIREAIE